MRRLLNSETGNVAITFALALLPMCVLIGGAVDFSRALSAKQQLRDTLDGAALAIGATPNFTQAQADQIAKDFAAANYPSQSLGAPAHIDSVTISDTEVTVNGSASVPTTFLNLIKIDQVDVKSEVKVERAGWNVEASLALDITGSMAGTPLSDLKTAAKDFVDIVVQDTQYPYTSKVALAPYSNSVNMGTAAMATNVRGAQTGGNCTNYGCSKYKFTNASGGQTTLNVTNCVSERTANAYNDTAPSTSKMSFVYAPSNNPCPSSPIVPLSDNKNTLKTAINNLSASGSTAGHLGIAWGWYMVSPNFGYLWPGSSQPNSYSDKKTMKVAVLMTDGEFNTMYCNGVISKNSGSGSGSASDHSNCNAPNGSSFSQAASLCTNMKNAGIIVYTVGFNLASGGTAETTLKNCASSTSAPYFNNPKTGSDLKAAFKNIAKSISQLKIAH